MRWFIYLLLFGLAGCLHPSAPVWTKVPTVEQLLTRLAVEAGRYSSLDGAAGVSLTAGEKYFSSQQFLLLERPDHLRADVLTAFGQLILQMTSDGETLSVFLHTTVPGRFLRGQASDENIYRFVKIPLATRELLPLLLYDPPLIAYQNGRVEVSDQGLTLILSGGDNRQELLFDRQLRLTGCRYFRTGEKYLSVDYRDFSKGYGFPQLIKVVIPQQQTQVKVSFSELKLNPALDIDRFRLQNPVNIPVEPLPE